MTQFIETYNGFEAEIFYDDEDSIFYGSIKNTKDSINFHGNTKKEVITYFHRAVNNYVLYFNGEEKKIYVVQ